MATFPFIPLWQRPRPLGRPPANLAPGSKPTDLFWTGHDENSGDLRRRRPHALAAFWANVLGTEVEDHSDFVDQLVADGRIPATDRITINGRSAFRDVTACRDPQGVEPRFYFQRVPEGKLAKNRVHLDIHVEPDRKAEEVARLTNLGAELIETHDDRGPLTYVMRDPEGNEFCVH